MKIVANNHADSLRRPREWDTAETTVLDSVRAELRSFYGEGDDTLPLELATLAKRLDLAGPTHGDHAA